MSTRFVVWPHRSKLPTVVSAEPMREGRDRSHPWRKCVMVQIEKNISSPTCWRSHCLREETYSSVRSSEFGVKAAREAKRTELAADEHPPNLHRARADLVEQGIPEVSVDGILVCVAVAAARGANASKSQVPRDPVVAGARIEKERGRTRASEGLRGRR